MTATTPEPSSTSTPDSGSNDADTQPQLRGPGSSENIFIDCTDLWIASIKYGLATKKSWKDGTLDQIRLTRDIITKLKAMDQNQVTDVYFLPYVNVNITGINGAHMNFPCVLLPSDEPGWYMFLSDITEAIEYYHFLHYLFHRQTFQDFVVAVGMLIMVDDEPRSQRPLGQGSLRPQISRQKIESTLRTKIYDNSEHDHKGSIWRAHLPSTEEMQQEYEQAKTLRLCH